MWEFTNLPPDTTDTVTVSVPRVFIPFVAWALQQLLKRSLWKDDMTYNYARQMVLNIKKDLMDD